MRTLLLALLTLMTARAAEPIKVACVGDSITQGAGAKSGQSYPSQLQALLGDGYQVGNFGVSGRTLLKKGDFPYWKEKKYQAALAMEPAIVIIMLGTNDTKPQNWKHEAEFDADYRELVKSFQSLKSKPKVFVCRPVPVPGKGNFGINEHPEGDPAGRCAGQRTRLWRDRHACRAREVSRAAAGPRASEHRGRRRDGQGGGEGDRGQVSFSGQAQPVG